MKKYLPFIFFFTAQSGALERPDFIFDRAKVAQAESPFALYRATADYFYALLDRNRNTLESVRAARSAVGWCAGDPHPENFGALVLRDGASTFTLNDMDDAGPCPLIMDLLRFLVGARFVDADADLPPAYLAGLRGESWPVPTAVLKLLKKSVARGREPDPDDLTAQGRLSRRRHARDVNEVERASVRAALGLEPVDMFASAKCGGGSHGLLRYEILLADPARVVELKTVAQPAIARVAPYVPAPEERIARTLALEQEARADAAYAVVRVDGTPMLKRPRLHGKLGMKIFDLERTERRAVLAFEAHRLGKLHARSLETLQVDPRAVASDVAIVHEHFLDLFEGFRRDRSYRSDCSPTR